MLSDVTPRVSYSTVCCQTSRLGVSHYALCCDSHQECHTAPYVVRRHTMSVTLRLASSDVTTGVSDLTVSFHTSHQECLLHLTVCCQTSHQECHTLPCVVRCHTRSVTPRLVLSDVMPVVSDLTVCCQMSCQEYHTSLCVVKRYTRSVTPHFVLSDVT